MNIPKIVQRKIAEAGGAYRGNVVSPVQFSAYVRAFDETECNGRTSEPGQLRAFDLAGFKDYPFARTLAESAPQVQTVCYVWRHNGGKHGRRIVYGATLATPDGVILRSVQCLRTPRAYTVCTHLEKLAKLRHVGADI